MKLKWAAEARANFLEIAGYFAEYSQTSSKKWRKGVYNSVQRIKTFPRSGRIVPEKNWEYLREALYEDYRIIYFLDDEEETITIVTILHGRRDVEKILQKIFG